MKRTGALLAVAVAVSGCAHDPDLWEGVAMGLNAVAADLEAQNRNCYWGPPQWNPQGPIQQWCPGDYGYQRPLPVACAPRDRDCDGYRDRPRRHDRDRRGEHKH